MKIKVNKDVTPNFRPNSARAKYYERIAKFNGKTVEAFAKSCEADCPSTPARGKLKGKPEPVQGWISWFNRNGYINLES